MEILLQRSKHPIVKMQACCESNLKLASARFLENKVTLQQNKIILNLNYILDNNLYLSKGMKVSIRHTGNFQCVSCHKNIKKIFGGYCFPCLKKKASADMCIMNPHLCHYMQGTCREPEWGDSYCYKPHYVYLSYTDKYKVGITRESQIPTRWIDQGATSAILIAKVTSRHQAGVVENTLKEILHDKSHWSKMLKNGNLRPNEKEFFEKYYSVKDWLKNHELLINEKIYVNTPEHLGLKKEIIIFDAPVLVELNYEVPDSISTIKSLTLEKNPEINEVITGLKGQYLFFSDKVFNMRKHEGFIVDIELSSP